MGKKHKIPTRKLYKSKLEEKRDMAVRFNLAFEGSRAKEFMSGHAELLRDPKLRKIYAKSQEWLGKMDAFLNSTQKGQRLKNTKKKREFTGGCEGPM